MIVRRYQFVRSNANVEDLKDERDESEGRRRSERPLNARVDRQFGCICRARGVG